MTYLLEACGPCVVLNINLPFSAKGLILWAILRPGRQRKGFFVREYFRKLSLQPFSVSSCLFGPAGGRLPHNLLFVFVQWS